MKLSEKGENRLYNSKNVFYDDDIEGDVVALWELSKVWEFEPDDFTGAVVLTVDEAKEIFWLLFGCWYEAEDTREKERILNAKWRELLPNRIEQAEKGDGKA